MKKEKNVLLLTLSFKKCACCGEVKPTTEFGRKKHREKWGFYAYCSECKQKKAKKYYLDNIDKCKNLLGIEILRSMALLLKIKKR